MKKAILSKKDRLPSVLDILPVDILRWLWHEMNCCSNTHFLLWHFYHQQGLVRVNWWILPSVILWPWLNIWRDVGFISLSPNLDYSFFPPHWTYSPKKRCGWGLCFKPIIDFESCMKIMNSSNLMWRADFTLIQCNVAAQCGKFWHYVIPVERDHWIITMIFNRSQTHCSLIHDIFSISVHNCQLKALTHTVCPQWNSLAKLMLHFSQSGGYCAS